MTQNNLIIQQKRYYLHCCITASLKGTGFKETTKIYFYQAIQLLKD